MNEICLIVGAGSCDPERLRAVPADLVIAADAGLTTLKKAGIEPNYIMGDFDSLGQVPEGENVFVSPAEKDDTDMMLAIKKALDLGCRAILICGGTGGRLEHTLANIQSLKYIAERGGQGYLLAEDCVCTVIKNGCLDLPAREQGYFSVFSLDRQARGVYLMGLKYPLVNATLSNDFPLGVSNEYKGSPVQVRVDDGTLLIVLEGGDHNPKEHCYTKK